MKIETQGNTFSTSGDIISIDQTKHMSRDSNSVSDITVNGTRTGGKSDGIQQNIRWRDTQIKLNLHFATILQAIVLK